MDDTPLPPRALTPRRSRRVGNDSAGPSPEERQKGFADFDALWEEVAQAGASLPVGLGAEAPDPSGPRTEPKSRALAPLDHRHATAVSAWRLDLSFLLGNGLVPPVAFQELAGLVQWCRDVGLPLPERIGRSSLDNIALVRGAVHTPGPDGQVDYQQVWVRKAFNSYRNPFARAIWTGASATSSDIVGLDADHVLARSRVAQWDDCWLLLFPVDNRANQPFGPIEKGLAPARFVRGRIDLDPLMGLKVYCTKLPKRNEIDAAVRDIAGQLADRHPTQLEFLQRMREEAYRHIR